MLIVGLKVKAKKTMKGQEDVEGQEEGGWTGLKMIVWSRTDGGRCC